MAGVVLLPYADAGRPLLSRRAPAPSPSRAGPRRAASVPRAAWPFPRAPHDRGVPETMVDYRAAHELPTTTPVRLTLPQMDDGPHLNYAIQWFTFAVVALVGVGTLIAQDLRRG